MAKYERIAKAPEELRTCSIDQLIEMWELTETMRGKEIPIIRGWLMDEITARNPSGFNSWLDQDAPEDKDLKKFVLS